MKLHISKIKSRCLYSSKSCAEVSRCFALARTLRVVGGAEDGAFAVVASWQPLPKCLCKRGLLLDSQAGICGLELILVTTHLIWIPAPCPEWPHGCPRGAPLHKKGETTLPLDPPRSSLRSAVLSCGGDEDRALVC